MSDTNEEFAIALPENDNDSKYAPLEDNLYEANCVGIVVRKMKKFKSEDLENKLIFVFQVKTETDCRYVKSKPLTSFLFKKSNLWKMLSAWTKQKTPEDLIEKMGTNGKFSATSLIGKPVKIVLSSYEYNGKSYNQIDTYMAPKANQADIVKDAIPNFLVKGSEEYRLADGITIHTDDNATETTSKKEMEVKPTLEGPAPVVDKNSDEGLPF